MLNEQYGTPRYLINTEPHWDHIHGNAYFPGVEVIGQRGVAERYVSEITERYPKMEFMKQSDPDSYWLIQHPAFPLNPPTRIFDDKYELDVGEHSLLIENCPGHTLAQTHVSLPQEGVAFVGDNVFYQCRTWLQESDPWQWMEALDKLAKESLIIIPGHGEPCTSDYIPEQKAVIQGWLDTTEQFIRRGLSEDEAVRQPFPKVDPYPLGQRLEHWESWVHEQSLRHLYRLISVRIGMGEVSAVPISRSL